ncbi:MAG: type II toxin-antitoxin system VapC family toxin [Geobacter sp.]|nr:type II toxin-antitoxin system VapC family toxin [Geobacter sp.]
MKRSRYLLDTTIISHLIKDPSGVVARKIATVGETKVCTSLVVACELRFGAAKKGSPKLTAQLESILSALDILPLEEPVDLHYADIRLHLSMNGHPIGHNDLLIAAHARSLGLVMVTNNTREFLRVPGLQVEDWLV